MELPLWLPVAFFGIALFYSSVGFGGGSSYLALLAISGCAYQSISVTALICNLIVTLGGCWHFYRAGYFKAQLVIPFLLFSVPAAYLGARIPVNPFFFYLLLGGTLSLVAARLLLPSRVLEVRKPVSWARSWALAPVAGTALGFLSGILGIGGGIFLSPLLLRLVWANIKEAAAAASFFIVVNSAAGLMGHLHAGRGDWPALTIPLGFAVFCGAQIGSRLGAYRMQPLPLQRILGVLVAYVAVRMLWEAAI